MIRIGKGIAGTLSAVALVLGASVASYAQSTTQPSDTSKGTTAQPSEKPHSETPKSQTEKTEKGATSRQAAPSPKEAAQEHFDREKVTLKDHIQAQIGMADANIEALKKMGDKDKGTAKKRDDDMEKKLTDLKDHLQKDLDKIDKATMSDWTGVHASVQHDLGALESELRTAENVTKIPVPHTGAANKQPSGTTNKQPSKPAPAPEEKH